MKKTAIVILNFNSAEDCRVCSDGLLAMRGVKPEDIIIVDNGSRPQERDSVERLCRAQGFIFLPAGDNKGYNAGNNVGLRYASERGYDYAMIANPDMIFSDRGYVEALASVLERDETVAAVGSDILTPEGIHQNPRMAGNGSWQSSFSWVGELFRPRCQENVPAWVDRPDESRYCAYLNGSCLMIRLSFLKEVGFFDERTFLYGEEPILGRQIEMAGMKAYYLADVSAVHNHRKSREGTSFFRLRHWRKSRLLYINDYSGFPWYGKLFATLSIRLYFMALGAYHSFRR